METVRVAFLCVFVAQIMCNPTPVDDLTLKEILPTESASDKTTLPVDHFYVTTSSKSLEELQQKEYQPAQEDVTTKDFLISEEKLQWAAARLACQNKSMILASPQTPYQNEQLKKYITENNLVPADYYSGYWIGAHRETDQGPWFWEKDEQNVEEFGWLSGEPNDFKGEDCVELKNDLFDLGWNNYYCTDPKRYICERITEKEIFQNKESDPVTDGSFIVVLDDNTEDSFNEIFRRK